MGPVTRRSTSLAPAPAEDPWDDVDEEAEVPNGMLFKNGICSRFDWRATLDRRNP